jgi:hypothetical protein
MKRRKFIIALAAAISPSSSFSQTAERARRVGILVSFNEADPDAQSYVKAMKQKLQVVFHGCQVRL